MSSMNEPARQAVATRGARYKGVDRRRGRTRSWLADQGYRAAVPIKPRRP